MESNPILSLSVHFAELTDPRLERQKLHQLKDILAIAICAMLCGADNWVEIERFGRAKEAWFSQLLGLKHGIPSHDTFGKVFAALDANQFEACFMRWMQAIVSSLAGKLIAVDGKRVRNSHDKANGKSAIHLVGVYASEIGLLLGQIKTEDKSNEITAIPALLAQLALAGCIVTIDAMGTQKAIAQQIIEQEADYVLSLKGNQGTLHQEVALYFEQPPAKAKESWTSYESIEKDHGRIERRKVTATDAISWLTAHQEWRGLTSIVKVEAERTIDNHTQHEIRYFISSLPPDAAKLAYAIRAHWCIESQLHWSLDVTFREDYSRVRIDHAAENLSLLRRIALNLLKQEKTAKVGIKCKRLQAGWDEKYLLKLFQGLAQHEN